MTHSSDGMDHSASSYVVSADYWWIPQVEIPFLVIIILLGLIGNISIIGAIVLEKKLKFIGNAFIVNLAVADLIVTSYVLPSVLANVIANRSLFSLKMCNVTALVVSLSCVASMYSLMCVAINRFIAVKYSAKYTGIFTKKKVVIIIAAVWIWSFALASPPVFGWGHYMYHEKMHVCMYDCTEQFRSYSTTFIALSIFVPLVITCLCYLGVFLAFNKNRARVRSMSNPDRKRTSSNLSSLTPAGKSEADIKRTRQPSRRETSERRLVITLFTAVILFTICWVPYALIILIDHDAPAVFKRSAAWLAFTNSAMNSILYGLLNRNFRNGYKKMWARVFVCFSCCEAAKRILAENSNGMANTYYSMSKAKARKMTTDDTMDQTQSAAGV